MTSPIGFKYISAHVQQGLMRFHNDILHTIGNTPLVRMNRMNEGLLPLMLVKMEFLNPGGSSKDRIGTDAEGSL